MRDFDLSAYVRRHNALAVLRALAWAGLAAVTWFVSWHAMYFIVGIILVVGGTLFHWGPSTRFLYWAGWAGTALLAVEGLRYGRNLFDMGDFTQSGYHEANQLAGGTAGGFNALLGRPALQAYFVSQFLFVAPRSTIRTVQTLRSLLFLDADTLSLTDTLLRVLAHRHLWIPVSSLKQAVRALPVLQKLGILWTKVNQGTVEVRLDPEFIKTCFPHEVETL